MKLEWKLWFMRKLGVHCDLSVPFYGLFASRIRLFLAFYGYEH